MKSGIPTTTFAIIIGILLLNVATASVVTDGLVSYWTFDKRHIINNTVKDVWGRNNGTVSGNPKVVPGKVGGALEFDGAGDFVNLTTLGDFGSQLGNSSFEVWIKTSNKTDWMTLINTHGAKCPYWGIELNGINNNNALGFEFMEGTLHHYISLKGKSTCSSVGRGSGRKIFDGKWHHIVFIYDYKMNEGGGGIGNITVYIDGVSHPSGTSYIGGDRTFVPFTDSVNLGARDFQRKTEGFFEGMIDEVRFYDRPLTADEVIQNFESTAPYNVEPIGKLSTVWGTLKTKL